MSLESLTRTEELNTVVKAAFDLGSGKFRVLVANVQGKNVQIKYSQGIDVPLGKDLAASHDHMLSETIQQIALNSLLTLKKQAEELGATEFQGIATAAFRNARNGDLFLEILKQRIGINLRIISQKEEGILDFCTAMAFFPELDEQNLVLWGSGAASFQIVAKNEEAYEVYEGPFATSHLTKIFIEEVQKELYTKESFIPFITPLQCEEFIEILKNKVPSPNERLLNKLSEPQTKVIATGGDTCIFAIPAKHIASSNYNKDQVRQMIQEILQQSGSDSELLNTLCFLYAIMDKCMIPQVTFQKKAAGNTLGLLSLGNFS